MTNEDILREEFNKLRIELIAKHVELGMKASGRWIEGLEVRSSGLTASLIGESYTEQLVNGRPPSVKMPPVERIQRWIEDKNIPFIAPKGKSEYSSLAWAIATKIKNEGTEYFKEGGTDLVSSVITPERVQSIIDKVTEFNISAFTTDLKKAYEEFETV